MRDGRGRLGSVDHEVEAGLVKAGAFALSDLLLGRVPGPGQGFRPAVVPEASGEAMLVHGEVYGEEGSALDSAAATLEVVSSDTGASVRTAAARLAPGKSPGRRVVQALLPLAELTAGHYLARIVVATGGVPRGAVVRPFTVAKAHGEGGGPQRDASPDSPCWRSLRRQWPGHCRTRPSSSRAVSSWSRWS